MRQCKSPCPLVHVPLGKVYSASAVPKRAVSGEGGVCWPGALAVSRSRHTQLPDRHCYLRSEEDCCSEAQHVLYSLMARCKECHYRIPMGPMRHTARSSADS